MATQIIKGDDLMLFKDNKSLAYATSHVLTLTGDAVSVSSKDHGIWQGNEVNKLSWEITSENLYTADDYDVLFTAMIARQPIDVIFGKEKEDKSTGKNVVDGDYTNWTPTATGSYGGKCVITSLVANANSGDNATYSLTLKGTGKIEKKTVSA